MRNGIIITLCVSLAAVLFFCIRITGSRGDTRMMRAADSCENELDEWTARQKSILYMFTDTITAKPELLDDYDAAVRWLDDVSGNYPEISACFMANPYAAHPVIMNTGWDPGEDYRPETRPWYRDTERAADGFSISAPYVDAQTGSYCITFARVVNGAKGEFLGIFGIDCFLDKLSVVLGESCTSRSYAFLVDSDGVIINGQCAEKGLRFACEATGFAEGVCFRGDDLKLKQVLINILGNAVKFTEPPGTVSFTAEQLSQSGDDCLVRFTMRDTGIGMGRDFLPRLFEAFSQEDGSSTNRYGGTGLGMAITKNIVDMMGGEIHVDSEKGVGSTFTVTVTLRQAQAQPTPEAPQTEARERSVSIAGRHVLIAEDVAQNAEILIDLLELEDVSSEWAENGQLAVERFRDSEAGRFDAILMDMRLPVMDGLAATRAIRALERPDARTVPIVALTANAFEEDVQQCLQAGMNAHLSKPVDVDRLQETLGRLLAEAEA